MDYDPDYPQPASRLPLFVAGLALAGVLLLFLLFLGQRSAQRELRAMILLDRANASLNTNAGAEAELLLAEVAELNSSTPGLWRRRAIARMMSGQTAEAAEAAREHLKESPNDVGVSALLGAALILGKDYAGAEQALNEALQIAPLQRDLVQNFSELRRLQKRPGDAAALIDQYLAVNPSDGFFQYKRAMAEVAGELSDARRKAIAEALKDEQAAAAIYVVGAAIDFRDGKADAARQKLELANQRASAQDMRTMLEDEFFLNHIQISRPAANSASAPQP
jgi:tetratricopeptide (TPR) repeat protein